MRPCAALEDQLVDYDELLAADRLTVEAHLGACAACREYLALVREIDMTLTARVSAIRLDATTVEKVRRQLELATPVARVSAWPELLDFVAAAALVACACGLAWSAGVFRVAMAALSSVAD